MVSLNEFSSMKVPEPSSEVEALAGQLCHLAGDYATTRDHVFVKRYHDTYHKLRLLGWHPALDLDCTLPDELMPAIHAEFWKAYNEQWEKEQANKE